MQDHETSLARSQAASFLHATQGLGQLVDAILSRQLDIILYPEVGMDPTTVKLASLRLAPVQLAAWGHPETTGLPTIDYYLSAEDFEPEGGQANYREQLVTLPHLGCCYQPLRVTPQDLDLAALGVDTALPLLLCPGTPFKYAPQHDWVFVEVARRLGRCQFIFFNHERENLSAKLEERLEFAFAQSDMYFQEYGVFIPWLPRQAFYALLKKADICLDPIGFSGFNTTMQAVECGLPVVTREGRFMRGRFASGILKRFGLRELIAQTEQEYADLTVKLAQDADYRQHLRERILASHDLVFGDTAPIRALEEFLIRVHT